MLEQYFLKPTTVDRIRSNWLAPQIESYVEWMHREGYADRNVFQRVPLFCRFDCLLLRLPRHTAPIADGVRTRT